MSESKRIVVVTGASRGLGLEWVRQLKQDPNALVIAVVRNPDTAEKLKPLLGPQVIPVKGDISQVDTFPTIAKEIERIGGGKVDVLINNAAVMTGTGANGFVGISKSTQKEWQEQWQVNVVGLVFFTIALLPLIEKSKEKKVINIASMLGDLGFTENVEQKFHYASYSVTKAAVTMANLKFHHEYVDKKIIFLALNPGWVNTELPGDDSGKYAPLQPNESIGRCLSFVNRATFEHSGKFWTLDGQAEVTNH